MNKGNGGFAKVVVVVVVVVVVMLFLANRLGCGGGIGSGADSAPTRSYKAPTQELPTQPPAESVVKDRIYVFPEAYEFRNSSYRSIDPLIDSIQRANLDVVDLTVNEQGRTPIDQVHALEAALRDNGIRVRGKDMRD